jgi:hypothetical protein
VLFLSLYEGRAANKFGLLTGQIVAVDTVRLGWLTGVSVVVLAGLAVIWRPLLFTSVDPEVAAARGLPAGLLSIAFTLLLGLAVSLAVQVVGALLVLSLLVTPAAAAFRVTASPVLAPVLSTVFAVVSAVGGILLALGGSIPISPFVTTISFAIYLGCRDIVRDPLTVGPVSAAATAQRRRRSLPGDPVLRVQALLRRLLRPLGRLLRVGGAAGLVLPRGDRALGGFRGVRCALVLGHVRSRARARSGPTITRPGCSGVSRAAGPGRRRRRAARPAHRSRWSTARQR